MEVHIIYLDINNKPTTRNIRVFKKEVDAITSKTKLNYELKRQKGKGIWRKIPRSITLE